MQSLNWLVDGSALEDRTRQGGAHALKGFSFQAGIALVRLTWLLTCRHRLVRLRYDGAQDIDLKFSDGKELYIQAKNYGQGNFTLKDFYGSLAGFARDVITARAATGAAPPLEFHLMLTSIPTQNKALGLVRRHFQAQHAPRIVGAIKVKYRNKLSNAALLSIATELLVNTQYIVGMSADPSGDLAAIAGMELLKFGVRIEQVDVALDHLLQQLKAGASFYLEDVALHLEDFVPEGHPANKNSAMRLLPGKAHLPAIDTIKNSFFTGQPVLWHAIAHNLDVARKELPAIEKNVVELCGLGGMVVIAGVAGSGKSSLIHRAAWNLHHRGEVVAVHVKFPGRVKKNDWHHIDHLIKLCGRPILLLVDDVWRESTFLADFELRAGPGLMLLGSSRPGEFPATELSYSVWRHDLGKMEAAIASELRAKLGVNTGLKPHELDAFLNTGQILALSLHLQGTSLNMLATRTLNSLSAAGREPYLDLCLGGMFDLATPASLMARRAAAASGSWPEPELAGLSFGAGANDSHIRVGHALVAAAVLAQSGIDQVKRVTEICTSALHSDDSQRRHTIRLLKYATRDNPASALAHRARIEREAMQIAKYAEFADLYQLENVLKPLGALDCAAAIVAKASMEQVRTAADVSMLLSLVNAANFNQAYPVLLAYYKQQQNLAGFKRFIYLTKRHGDFKQWKALAEAAVAWLPLVNFPPRETAATFDMLIAGPKPILHELAPIAARYAEQCGMVDREPAMSAIRLAIATQDRGILCHIFDAALQAARTGILQNDIPALQLICRMASKRVGVDAPRQEQAYSLLRACMPMTGSDVDISLMRALAHVTPPLQVRAVHQQFNAWPRPAAPRAQQEFNFTLTVLAKREQLAQLPIWQA